MEEIYWITRFDGICVFLGLITILSIITTIIVFFIGLFKRSCASIYPEGSQNWKRYIDTSKTCFYFAKRYVIVFFVSGFMNIFIPTTNEALLIYGVGGTIDYVKSNKTAKQLPDKYIKALDKLVDNLNKEEKMKYETK